MHLRRLLALLVATLTGFLLLPLVGSQAGAATSVPIGVFRGWVRLMLTFVVPIAVMTSYPALAALGLLSARGALGALLGAAFMLFVSRRIWLWALGHYASASS